MPLSVRPSTLTVSVALLGLTETFRLAPCSMTSVGAADYVDEVQTDWGPTTYMLAPPSRAMW